MNLITSWITWSVLIHIFLLVPFCQPFLPRPLPPLSCLVAYVQLYLLEHQCLHYSLDVKLTCCLKSSICDLVCDSSRARSDLGKHSSFVSTCLVRLTLLFSLYLQCCHVLVRHVWEVTFV